MITISNDGGISIHKFRISEILKMSMNGIIMFMKPTITFDEYNKIEVRVGKIVAAAVPEGSNKLIQFTVDFGAEIGQKTIFSGIKEWYSPDELVGVKTMWVVNLAPKKTPFGDSEGMLFACDTVDEKPYIVRVGDEIEVGSEFH